MNRFRMFGDDMNKRKIIILVISLFIISGLLGYFVIYPKVTDFLQEKEDQKEAQRVINLIKSLEDKEITADSGDDLSKIQLEYDSLSKKQKKLVANYSDLEKAYTKVEEAKDKKAAQEIIKAIDLIDMSSLSSSDTSVQELRAKYEKLTKAQKNLVTNKEKLLQCEQMIEEKKAEEEKQRVEAEARAQAEQQKREMVQATFANLVYYEGSWGDFGAHVNKYQGMVEAAIKASISLSNYFGDVNGTSMGLKKMDANEIKTLSDNVFGSNLPAVNQAYLVMFQGPSVSGTGGARTLLCLVSSPDGMNLVYNEIGYY